MNVLFSVIVWELALGGGGRIFALGPLSIRMVLFALAILLWIALAISSPQRSGNERLALQLLILFFFAHISGAVQGVMAGFETARIVGEIQPLLYWLIAPFFALSLSQISNVELVARIIMRAGLIVAVICLALAAGLLGGVIPAATFYRMASSTQEIFFRSFSLFFYKGFFYVAIAIVFTVALRPRIWWLSTSVMMLIISASLTRGLILAVFLGILVVLIAQRRWVSLGMGMVMLLLMGAMLSGSISVSDLVEMGDRLKSVSQRIEDTMYVVREMDTTTILFGEGIGSLINMRANVENSYMWALWKLGVVGLAFWLLPLGLSLWYFLHVPFSAPRYNLAVAYIAGVLMLYGLTATNPFVNNPIGLSYLIIALFSLRALAHDQSILSRGHHSLNVSVSWTAPTAQLDGLKFQGSSSSSRLCG